MHPTLYRMYDWMGCLLYVGQTINPLNRLRDHYRGKDWWDDIVAITLEKFDTLDELIHAEREAIETEHPVYNVAGNSLRKRIAAVGRQIDDVYGNPPGTCLKSIYWVYWPPEMCTPDNFETVYAMAVRDLKVAQLVMAGVSVDDAFDLAGPIKT